MKSKISISFLHQFSFVAAVLVHSLVAGLAFGSSKPIVITNQAIQVSFVAPSSSEKNQKTEDKVLQNSESKNALRKKLSEKSESAKNENDKNLSGGKKTSGRQDLAATATNSAESDPAFNAAYLNNPAPEYPTIAKRNGIQGKVLLNVLVKVDGTAASVQLMQSSGSENLDLAALKAVKQWKFIPARRGGDVVQASVIVPVEFKII